MTTVLLSEPRQRLWDLKDYIITAHAAREAARRNIDVESFEKVLSAPGQRETVRLGRDVLQSRIEQVLKEHLIRVFVDIDRTPAEVATVYRTSNIEKYWRVKP